MPDIHTVPSEEQVLCVFHDTSYELRQAVRHEARPDAHREVCVPRLSGGESALWLSCDDGRDRWYVYTGQLIKGFTSAQVMLRTTY